MLLNEQMRVNTHFLGYGHTCLLLEVIQCVTVHLCGLKPLHWSGLMPTEKKSSNMIRFLNGFLVKTLVIWDGGKVIIKDIINNLS